MSWLDKLSDKYSVFEPTTGTKRQFLSVRHRDYMGGSVTLPGLFALEEQGRDTMWLAVAVLLEVIGMVFLVIAAAFPAVWAATTVGFTLAVDIALAIAAHHRQPNECEARVKTILAKRALSASGVHGEALEVAAKKERSNLANDITSCRRWKTFFSLLLLVSAMAKVAFFVLAYVVRGGHPIDVIVGLMCLFYVVAAVIHIIYTGYAIAAAVLQFRLWRNHNSYLDTDPQHGSTGPQNASNTNVQFVGPVNHPAALTGITQPISVGRHTLSSSGLETRGVLVDADVQTLCNNAPQQQQDEVAILCLAAQYKIMQSATSRAALTVSPASTTAALPQGSTAVLPQFPLVEPSPPPPAQPPPTPHAAKPPPPPRPTSEKTP